jgi:hypothetical protein
MKPNIFIDTKPVQLALGKDYNIGFSEDSLTEVKLIKATPKGYKFLNLRTSICLRQLIMYPSKLSQHVGKGELWFFLPKTMIINEISIAKGELV